MNEKLARLCKDIKSDEAFLITSSENVFYLSSFSGEGMLVIDCARAIIVTDFRYIEDAKKNGEGFSVENIERGIENIIGKNIKKLVIEEKNITVSRYKMYQQKMPDTEFVDGSDKIDAMRLIKDENEIRKIKTAAEIATYAFKDIVEHLSAGVSERELALKFEYLIKKAGASSTAFDTVVASGKNSSMPHACVTDRILEKGDFVTFDFGCLYDGYCSDMTRTIAIGNISDIQKDVYDIVLKAQKQALSQAMAGKQCRQVDAVARDIITDAGYKKEFGHALGHGVGILIHEQPTLSSKSDKILKDNMVVTIEPGIYIEGCFGVRIEDLVVIHGDTPLNLSDFTKELITV